jgi:hypothetical protein
MFDFRNRGQSVLQIDGEVINIGLGTNVYYTTYAIFLRAEGI